MKIRFALPGFASLKRSLFHATCCTCFALTTPAGAAIVINFDDLNASGVGIGVGPLPSTYAGIF